jgi:hypothetical protein
MGSDLPSDGPRGASLRGDAPRHRRHPDAKQSGWATQDVHGISALGWAGGLMKCCAVEGVLGRLISHRRGE